MKYNLNFLLLIIIFILQISTINSNIYPLKKISSKLKTLHRSHRILSPENDPEFLHQAYGDSYALNYYYTTLYFGPKKMPQTFILDTGSPTTTAPCSKCKSCGKHLNKPYEFLDETTILKCYTDECNSISSICVNSQCGFSISYSEGSRLSGFYNLQDIYLENINNSPIISSQPFTLPIGCTTTETHLFVTQLADGIMGLNNSGKSFVSLLFRNKVIKKEIFSICLGQNDGYFSVGDIDTAYHKSKVAFVPLIWGHTNFYIKLNNMQVGDNFVSTKNYNGFVDSGTTISYFPKDIYNNILKYFDEYCEKSGNKCGKFEDVKWIGYCGMFSSKEERTNSLNNYWPNITIFLEGYNYTLTPNDYYFEYNDKNKIGACLGFEGESSSKITIGGTFMHGHDIIFDKENQMMGFAEADCNRGRFKKDNISNVDVVEDNVNLIKDTKDGKQKNKNIDKFKEKFLYAIIIVSSLIVIGLIIFILLMISKKYKLRKYNSQVDESIETKKNKENANNNVLEIKHQNTHNNENIENNNGNINNV